MGHLGRTPHPLPPQSTTPTSQTLTETWQHDPEGVEASDGQDSTAWVSPSEMWPRHSGSTGVVAEQPDLRPGFSAGL